MVRVMVGLIVAGGVIAVAQDGRPVFRSDTYALAIDLTVYEGTEWCAGTDPHTGLTAGDFRFAFDGQDVAFELEEDAERPGHYLFGFFPPDEMRDGQEHEVRIEIGRRGFLRPAGVAVWTVTIPRLAAGAETVGNVVSCCEAECRRPD